MAQKRINRKYKDSLFRMVFREKKELLSLYNAINGSDYQDPEALTINTLEDVVYMSIKNDTSFILDDYLNLYEAQSTINPNMPLRGLFYYALLLQGYVDLHKLNVYSSKQIFLPTPRYIVFYNGPREQEEKKLLKLSDSFIKKLEIENPSLECTALFLNINFGYNKELMEKCRKLYEYSYLVNAIREYQQSGSTIESAISQAAQHCIENGILEDFLRKHRGEVLDLILTEYNEELHIQDEKNISYHEGLADGIIALIEAYQEFGSSQEQASAKLMERFSITKAEASEFLKQHWKGQNHPEAALSLILTEYNEELHIQDEKNISYQEGEERGRKISLIETYQELGLPRSQTSAKLIEKFSMTEDEAETYLKQYWKES